MGQGAAGPVGWGVRVSSCPTGMLPNHVQTQGRETALTAEGGHELSSPAPNTAKQGAFSTIQSQITAGAVTSSKKRKNRREWSSGIGWKIIFWLRVAITEPEKQISE